MDISARAWLIVIGILLVAAVLLDGYRRMRKNNRVNFGDQKSTDFDFNEDLSELPNGGARVVERRDDSGFDFESDFDDEHSAVQQGASSVEQASPQTAKKRPIDELFVINVISKRNEVFAGKELLDVLLDCGLRYGDMNIFHAYDDQDQSCLYSVANAVEPGIFDVDNMSKCQTPGLSFFMTLPGPKTPLQSYDNMLRCARQVALQLNADLKDSEHNLLTSQSSMHDRQRIEDYIRRSFRAKP